MDISVKAKNLNVDTAPVARVAVQLDGALNSALDRMTKQLRRNKRNVVNHHAKRRAAERMLSARQYDICADDVGKEVHEDALLTVIGRMSPEIATITASDAIMRMEMGVLPLREENSVTSSHR